MRPYLSGILLVWSLAIGVVSQALAACPFPEDTFCNDFNDCTCDYAGIDGGCVHPPQPDGTACSNACYAVNVCQSGACKNSFPVNCNDGQPCWYSPGCHPEDGCIYYFHDEGTVCRPAADQCDVEERCTGNSSGCPPDKLKSPGTPCRAAAGVCDLAESCTGSSASCPPDVKSTAVCRPAAATGCDVAESCPGNSNSCPPDGFAGSGTPCRPAAGLCDVAETCSGQSAACPVDGFKASGICRSSAGDCDLAETCDGSGPDCPLDGVAASGQACRAESSACDIAEFCDGALATCPADQTNCNRQCAGLDGTTCDDGNACTAADTCQAGTCAAGPTRSCDDGNPCTADTCNSAAGCVNAPRSDGEPCDDGDPGTGISSCNDVQACTGVSMTVTLQPEILVPPTQRLKQVKIPMTFEVSNTAGTEQATATAQGLVDCVDVPPALRPKKKCGALARVAGGYGARVESVFLRVTPRVKRSLGRTQARSVAVGLPLTKLGRKLFAQLGANEGGLRVHIQCTLRDRQGGKIEVTAPTDVERQR